MLGLKQLAALDDWIVAGFMNFMHMEIWNYLEILKKRVWFLQKDDINEKLDALAKISEIGLPSTISSLVPFLKHNNAEIRVATCKTIITLFSRIKSKKEYYETLKYCDISESDIDVFEHWYAEDQYIPLLAIASLNGSGYVREKATKKLSVSTNPKAIPFLIYRLADWVMPVRQAALNGIYNFLKTQYLDTYINNLAVFEWLQQVERVDLSSVYHEIVRFIVDQNRDYVFGKFKFYPDKARLLLAKYMAGSSGCDLKTIKLLIADKHFLVRSLALQSFSVLSRADINTLLRDKSAKIRLQALYKLEEEPDFTDLVSTYVADSAASIREYARYSLKQKNQDFTQTYYYNLLNHCFVIGSLLGMAETEAKQYSGMLETYLQDKKVRVKKAAFLSLRKLDEEKAYCFALANLGSDLPGIRNTVIEFLAKKANAEVLEKARSTYQSGYLEIKKSMLKLFSKIGGWSTLADIILGTINEDASIRELSFIYLQRWRVKAVRLFIQPSANELERARQIFTLAMETHENRNFFKNNPLKDLNFFLK